MLKYGRWLVISTVLVFLTACGGGNSDDSAGKEYSLIEGKNSAVMGPLEEARVEVYRLIDLEKPIATTKTKKLGSFDVNISGISKDELVLVVVSGGKDVDVDDDGQLDDSPTDNKGTLHGFATIGDLEEGKAKIGLLSEIIYQYSLHLLSQVDKIANNDFKRMVETVSQFFMKNRDIKLEEVVSFNPLADQNKLAFDYAELVNGQSSLSSMYHENESIEKIRERIAKIFRGLPITLNDARLEAVKENFKVSFSTNHAVYTAEGVDFSKGGEAFVKKGSSLKITIDSIDSEYRLLRWHGCDIVSDDNMTCEILNISSDKSISAIVVPEIKIASGVTILDITSAYVSLDKNDSNIDENMTIYSDILDSNTSKLLSEIKVGDIIVHKTSPVFFRKVVNINKINDFRYNVQVKQVSIEEVLESGYISADLTKAGTLGTLPSSKVISRSLILPNGEIISFDPNEPMGITLHVDNSKKVIISRSEKTYPHIVGEEIENGYKATIELSEDAQLEGTITIKPIFSFDVSWGFFTGVEQLHIETGVNLKNNIDLSISKEWSYSKEKDLKTYTFVQTIMVGPLPVVVSEPIRFYVGVDGLVKAEASLSIVSTISPTITVDWTKESVHNTIGLKNSSKMGVNLGGSAEAYAYFGIEPSIQVYGIGIGFDNKVGLYSEAEGEVVEDVRDIENNITISAGLKGEIGLKYIGTIGFNSTWEVIDDALGEINNKLPNGGSYDKKWAFKTFDTSVEYSKEEESGHIVVSGNERVTKDIAMNDSFYHGYSFVINNDGKKAVYWKAEIVNENPGAFNFSFDEESTAKPKTILCGKLDPEESKDVIAHLTSNDVSTVGNYSFSVNVYQSENDLCSVLPYVRVTSFFPVFSSNIEVNVKPSDLKLPKTPLEVSLYGSTVKKLSFDWKKQEGYEELNGYRIYMADYVKSDDAEYCSNIRLFAETEETSYREDLLSLKDTSDSLRKLEDNKTYCFILTGFKNYRSINGKTVSYEETLSLEPSVITPFQVEEDINDSDTFVQELDIMFLVDMTGSYSDDLETFKRESQNIIDTLQKKLPEGTVLKIGVSSFEDYPISPYGASSDKPYTLEQSLTTDTESFKEAINTLKLGSGSDGPEAQLEGLYQTVTDPHVGWGESAMKMIILFTDANFHDSDREPSYPGHGSTEVKNVLKAHNVSVIGMGSGSISPDLDNISDWTFLLGRDSSGVVSKISSLIEAIPGTKIDSRDLTYRKIEPDLDFVGDDN